MTPIDYFKLQAKNLFRDFKTKSPVADEAHGGYTYAPKYFDVDAVFLDFDLDEDHFSLMNAQHVIALMVGFRTWAELVKASAAELELEKLIFDHQDKMNADDWAMYVAGAEHQNKTTFDAKALLEIYMQVVIIGEMPQSGLPDYRLNKNTPR